MITSYFPLCEQASHAFDLRIHNLGILSPISSWPTSMNSAQKESLVLTATKQAFSFGSSGSGMLKCYGLGIVWL